MIPGFFVKLLLGIAVAGVLAYDVGAPVVARIGAEDAAQQVAEAAARSIRLADDQNRAREAAREVAAAKGLVLSEDSIEFLEGDAVRVRVEQQVDALVLDRLPPLEDWYTVAVDVTAEPREGGNL